MRYVTLFVVLLLLAGSTSADTLAPQSIDSLYAKADFVGIVRIESGHSEMGKGAIHKASIKSTLKGDSSAWLFFGPFAGGTIGYEYLVFLVDSKETVSEHWSKPIYHDGPSPDYVSRAIINYVGRGDSLPHPSAHELPGCFSSDAKYHAVMFEGFGMMPIEYV